MSDDEWRAPNGFTYGSLVAILRHTMQAERGWSMSLRGEPPLPRPPGPRVEPSMAELLGDWQAEEAKMRPWLLSLKDADLVERRLPPRAGGPSLVYWQAMSHVTFHSMQHRSEAAEALTMAGRSPGELDFFFFLRPRE